MSDENLTLQSLEEPDMIQIMAIVHDLSSRIKSVEENLQNIIDRLLEASLFPNRTKDEVAPNERDR